MATEIKVPTLGESVTEATVAQWLKKVGDPVAVDEPLVELETDKVTLEVNATAAGTLAEIAADHGVTVEVGALLGVISDGAAQPKVAAEKANGAAQKRAEAVSLEQEKPAPALSDKVQQGAHDVLSPAVRKLVEDNGLDPAKIRATGKDGRLTKEDVL